LWRRCLRADAAFAILALFDYLVANEFGYAIRLKATKVLQRRIAHMFKRRRERPSLTVQRQYANFTYQASSWANRAGLLPRWNSIPVNYSRVLAFWSRH
jgi:hypothetical protein